MGRTLITGANRGIGLELARLLSDRGDDVTAACRSSSPELDALDVRVIPDVDVADGEAIDRLADRIRGEGLDWLIHNAGQMTREGLDDLDLDRVRALFEVNTLGPLRVTQALLPNLGRGSKVGILTSLMGSIEDNGSGGYYGYRISKAAVNMVGANLAHDLRSREITVLLLHPGMVATRMTGGVGVPVQEAARGLIDRLDSLGIEETGTFWHADGRRLPW